MPDATLAPLAREESRERREESSPTDSFQLSSLPSPLSAQPPPALIGGPYRPPPFEVGSSLACRVYGRVTVQGVSRAPARRPEWHRGRSSVPVFTPELVRAIRTRGMMGQASTRLWEPA